MKMLEKMDKKEEIMLANQNYIMKKIIMLGDIKLCLTWN